eukprot:TRINITY_DN4380_c0_g1_i7.p1 TRINITY_DN4380_c0_g1~~TRINITY_DN4380_c0_g1_i7.p1  ORF type:complete len:518 (-),score=73.54 TRINITY_DN4380_c0_g1_i7:1329-2858(-)
MASDEDDDMTLLAGSRMLVRATAHVNFWSSKQKLVSTYLPVSWVKKLSTMLQDPALLDHEIIEISWDECDEEDLPMWAGFVTKHQQRFLYLQFLASRGSIDSLVPNSLESVLNSISHQHMVSLELSANVFSKPQQFQCLRDFIARTNLLSLVFVDNHGANLSNELVELFEFLTTTPTSLVTLDVTFDSGSAPHQLKAACEMLRRNSTLTNLTLRQCRTSDQGKMLASALTENRSVSGLHILNNTSFDNELDEIATDSVRIRYLTSHSSTHQGLSSFEFLKHLRGFHFCCGTLKLDHLSSIADLVPFSSLEYLGLWNILCIEEDSALVGRCVASIANHPTLTQLKLVFRESLTPRFYSSLFASIGTSTPSLKSCDIDGIPEERPWQEIFDWAGNCASLTALKVRGTSARSPPHWQRSCWVLSILIARLLHDAAGIGLFKRLLDIYDKEMRMKDIPSVVKVLDKLDEYGCHQLKHCHRFFLFHDVRFKNYVQEVRCSIFSRCLREVQTGST